MPKKLASVVKPNMRHAQENAFDSVGDHLMDKKATDYQHISQTFI